MNFKTHSHLEGKHSFLSPSKYHWINYDEDKLITSYQSFQATLKGTEDHAFAATCIKRKQKLPRNHNTINMFVNDAIGFRMTPEQPLAYSDNCFGTADAISFYENKLRIHDLKTGKTATHIEQLMVYAALFCLEYDKNPNDIDIELRIYQNGEINMLKPDPEDIETIMAKIMSFDIIIERLKQEDD